MGKVRFQAFVLASIVGLTGCASGGGPATETTVPAPSPSFSFSPPATAGPGGGDADLSITIKPSASEPAIYYTLVCKQGVPTKESKHPSAAEACSALKNNPAVLRPAPPSTKQECTLQYGGPQKATITGTVDGSPVDVSFARSDGCEISRWNAAAEILGYKVTL
jgi:hypothetical protein